MEIQTIASRNKEVFFFQYYTIYNREVAFESNKS